MNPILTKALLIFLLPFSSFLLLMFFGRIIRKFRGVYATAVLLSCFLLAISVYLNVLELGPQQIKIPWLSISSEQTFYLGLKLDYLGALMLLIVTFVSFLVHLFSIEYLRGDRDFEKYFAYLGLFTFSMIGILLSTSLLMLFIFWELVGLSSYLLIGFWYEKQSAISASKKAFITNRVGDAGFLAGILIIYSYAGTLDFDLLIPWFSSQTVIPTSWMIVMGIGLFLGCVGKSAQFPLQIWLPDAMEGPTPVSALIHAATMVAAGIFLLARVFFMLSPDVLTVIAYIGAITAFMGAIAACTQYDIKKVLAYSTVSQLGYMVMAMGVGAYQASLFHLITHAFFKACLFLASGAVIHSMHRLEHEVDSHFDAQDMRFMGGLYQKMPITFICYIIATCSLVGLPLFSGFLSKDAILLNALDFGLSNSMHSLIPILGFVSVFLTAFYMLRQIIMVFFGEFRLKEYLKLDCFDKVKETPWLMRIPIILLAALSFAFVFSLNPIHADHSWIMTHLNEMFAFLGMESEINHGLSTLVILISLGLALLGIVFSWLKFQPKKLRLETLLVPTEERSFFYRLSQQNWFLDRIYFTTFVPLNLSIGKLVGQTDQKVIDWFVDTKAKSQVVLAALVSFVDKWGIDGLVNVLAVFVKSFARFARTSRSGKVQNYLIGTLIGILLIAVSLLFV